MGVVWMGKSGPNCDALLLLAALVSIQMSRQLTPDQMGLLAAFFEVLGDNLALLALCPAAAEAAAESDPSHKKSGEA